MTWTRRELLASLGLILSGALTTAIIERLARTDSGNGTVRADQELESMVHRFFFYFDNEEYGKSFDLGLRIAQSDRRQDLSEYARWLNNIACAAVWDGHFERSHDFLNKALNVAPNLDTWWLSVINSNLAYVRYHLGWRTSELVHCVEQAVRDLGSPQAPRPPEAWLQLWSRTPQSSPAGRRVPQTLVPPFAVLTRLYSKEGRYREAFESGKRDIELQGTAAQGTRIILGLIARPACEEKTALAYTDEVSEIYNPSSSSAHMMALRDVILADLRGAPPSDEFSFSGQAGSIKAEYYSWTTFADLKYLLAAQDSRKLRQEFGQRVLESYEKSPHTELESVRRIRRLLRV